MLVLSTWHWANSFKYINITCPNVCACHWLHSIRNVMSANDQVILAGTGRAHCQRQVAFFLTTATHNLKFTLKNPNFWLKFLWSIRAFVSTAAHPWVCEPIGSLSFSLLVVTRPHTDTNPGPMRWLFLNGFSCETVTSWHDHVQVWP